MAETSGRRSAVIEIGSRAVRVLVAEVRDGRLEEIWAKSTPFRLPTVATAGQLASATQTLTSIVEGFNNAALSQGVKAVLTFGTAALRGTMAMNNGEAILGPGVKVLTPEEEAAFSALAAASAAPDGHQKSMLTIDQGGRSLEIAITPLPVELSKLRYQSLPLGTEVLLPQLITNGRDIAALLRKINDDFSAFHPVPLEHFATVLQGSVATKLAWLAIGGEGSYRPARVHGQAMNVRTLTRMLASFAVATPHDWGKARPRFGGDGQDELELERVLAGTVALSAVLQSYQVRRFYVSSRGTRHGALLWHSKQNSTGKANGGSQF